MALVDELWVVLCDYNDAILKKVHDILFKSLNIWLFKKLV